MIDAHWCYEGHVRTDCVCVCVVPAQGVLKWWCSPRAELARKWRRKVGDIDFTVLLVATSVPEWCCYFCGMDHCQDDAVVLDTLIWNNLDLCMKIPFDPLFGVRPLNQSRGLLPVLRHHRPPQVSRPQRRLLLRGSPRRSEVPFFC